jgi:hypothetical protein
MKTEKLILNKIDYIIDCLTESDGGYAVGEGNIKDAVTELKAMKEVLKNSLPFSEMLPLSDEQIKWVIENIGQYLQDRTSDFAPAYRIGRRDIKDYFCNNKQ